MFCLRTSVSNPSMARFNKPCNNVFFSAKAVGKASASFHRSSVDMMLLGSSNCIFFSIYMMNRKNHIEKSIKASMNQSRTLSSLGKI